MLRVQPTTESVTSHDSVAESSRKERDHDARKKVATFSWGMAVEFFQKVTADRMGKADIYFMDDGLPIKDEKYLSCVTAEICREFGFELLNILTDLIVPVGFGYPSLNNGLQELIEDAFKPVSKTGQRKTIVWIEDEQWNAPGESVIELLVRQLLLDKIEPFLIAPNKYFDKEVMSSVFKILASDPNVDVENVVNSEKHWQTFANLLNFGFLLCLRSLTFPIILLHFGQKLAEKVNAFRMMDLAASEGHEVKYIKNTPSVADKEMMIANFTTMLVNSSSTSKKIRLENMD